MVEQLRSDAPVLVIGLGRFGAACAGELDRLDREVLAIDDNLELVQKWSERVTHTVQADAKNIDALKQIGANPNRGLADLIAKITAKQEEIAAAKAADGGEGSDLA